MPRSHPLFITLEGGEGTGKTSLIDKLAATLIDRGYQVVKTREPGGTKLGEEVRKLLLSHSADVKICDYAELMLFLAARTQQIHEVIAPALREGKIVLCDRFNDSTVAYQGAARGLGTDIVQKQCELACHGVLPNLTLFFDVEPEIGLARTRKTVKETADGDVDRIESEEIAFHHTVRKAMQDLADENPDRIRTIDASLPFDQVFEIALATVSEALETANLSNNT